MEGLLPKTFYVLSIQMVVGCPIECTCLNGVADCSGKNLNRLPSFTEPQNYLKLYLNRNGIVGVTSIFQQHSSSFNEVYFENGLNSVNNYISNSFFDGTPEQESKVELINLEKNLISMLPNKIFSSLSNLTSLSLSENTLESFDSNIFSKNNQLRYLDLSKNQITRLDKLIFSNNSQLETIILAENKLTTIHNMFDFQNNLRYLNLESNSLTNLTNDIFSACGDTLSYLNLGNNQLKSIPLNGFLCNLSILTNLMLNNNFISTSIVREMFTGTESIQDLSLSHNALKNVSGNILPVNSIFRNELSNLVDLDLSSNHIDSLKLLEFNGLSELVSLNIGNNSITTMNKYSFFGLGKLEDLESILVKLLLAPLLRIPPSHSS